MRILLGLVTDNRPEIRKVAARSPGSVRVTTGQVLPALVSALRDDYIDLRAAAASALGQLASGDETVVSALKAVTPTRIRMCLMLQQRHWQSFSLRR